MNHPITLGGLLLVLGCIGGLVTAAFGALMVFAAGMSDAPAAGDAAGKKGCITFVAGVAILVGCIVGLVL